jgi:hypothetical protein
MWKLCGRTPHTHIAAWALYLPQEKQRKLYVSAVINELVRNSFYTWNMHRFAAIN